MLMEPIFLFTAFLIFSSFLITLLVFMKAKDQNSNSRLKLPPGPRPLPIIGNMHQLHGSPIHHLLRDLAKKYGPLIHLQFGEVSNIIVSSPEVAKEFLKTHDLTFAQRPSYILAFKIISYDFKDIIFSPYGNYWRQLRKICMMELLSPKRVQSFRTIREDEVLNLVRSISQQNGSIVNMSQKIFSLSYGITARVAFGKRNKHQKRFTELVQELTKLCAAFNIADLYPSLKLLQVISGMRSKLEAAHKQVDEIMESILNDHKEKMKNPWHSSDHQEANKDDLIDVLLKIQRSADFDPPLTDTNIKAVIYDIFSAGSETSSTIVEWAMSEMIKNPRIMKEAQDEVRSIYDERGNVDESSLDELKYLQAIIKETLRLHPSAPLLVPRECSEQCEINGFDIPTKARILINAWAIGRDPNYWSEPENFNPKRFLDSDDDDDVDFRGNHFEFIPFGAGRRMCPGIAFALPTIELPLANFLFHFDWKLAGELKHEELDMTEELGVTVKRKNDLYLIPVPYHRSSFKQDDH